MKKNQTRVPYSTMYEEFFRVLSKFNFTSTDKELIAETFASSSLDGVYTHGLNSFPGFIEYVQSGYVQPDAAITPEGKTGQVERYDGNFRAGILNGIFCTDRSMEIAAHNGIGCVAVKNTNHWMRGGTYGWRAAEKGFIHICFTNSIPLIAPWGGTEARLGNNPLIIAIPGKEGRHIVMDMALSQFSMGKLLVYKKNNGPLPYYGGYDEKGDLSIDANEIVKTKRLLPIGYYKGAALSLTLDLLTAILTGGDSTALLSAKEAETGVSQVFISIKIENSTLAEQIIEQAMNYTYSENALTGNRLRYPGENTWMTRLENQQLGIPVDETIWDSVLKM